MFENDELKSV